MSKFNLSRIASKLAHSLKKHSPEILMALGITGMISGTVMAVKATPRALEMLEEEREARKQETGSDEELSKVDVVKTVWKCYIPTVVTTVASTACLIGSNSVNLRRNAALATAYTLSETALQEYHDKVVEKIGEKKEREIHDEIAKDKVEKSQSQCREIIVSKGEKLRCINGLEGQVFYSDYETLRKVANDLNLRMRSDLYVSLNDYYEANGIKTTKVGDILGWNIDKGYIDLIFSSQLDEDNVPCLVVDFRVPPNYGYDR